MVTPQAVVKTIKEETLKFTGQDLNLRLNAAETQGRYPKREDLRTMQRDYSFTTSKRLEL